MSSVKNKRNRDKQTTTVEKGRYVVATLDGKDCLVRVERDDGIEILGYHEYKDEEAQVQFDRNYVQAVLSDDPYPGRVYGANTVRLIDVGEESDLDVYWYFNASEEQRDAIYSAIRGGVKRLKKLGVDYALPWFDVKVVLNTNKNVTSRTVHGTYQVKAGNDTKDILTFKYHPETEEYLTSLFTHEVAHGLWARALTPRARLRWMEKFSSMVTVGYTTEDDVQSVLAHIKEQLSTNLTGLSDNETRVLDALVAKVNEVFAVKPQELEAMLNMESGVALGLIDKVSQGLIVTYAEKERDTHVTEYANTNAQEFFCEWFANHLHGIATPKYLQALEERTIKALKQAADRV